MVRLAQVTYLAAVSLVFPATKLDAGTQIPRLPSSSPHAFPGHSPNPLLPVCHIAITRGAGVGGSPAGVNMYMGPHTDNIWPKGRPGMVPTLTVIALGIALGYVLHKTSTRSKV